MVSADVHWVGLGNLNLDGVGAIDGNGPVNVDWAINVDGIRLGHWDSDLLDDRNLHGNLDVLNDWVWDGHLLGDVDGNLALNMDGHGHLHGDLDSLLVDGNADRDIDRLGDGDLSDLSVTSSNFTSET